MKLEIREMGPEDYDQKGDVHWKSWQETYAGLIDEASLSRQTPGHCRDMAQRYPENTLVAELDGNIVGFSCYGQGELPGSGEIVAIYLLKQAQGLGIGRRLMDAALEKLSGFDTVELWVLRGNDRAIGFYEHYGFRLDGTVRQIRIGTALRMVYRRQRETGGR